MNILFWKKYPDCWVEYKFNNDVLRAEAFIMQDIGQQVLIRYEDQSGVNRTFVTTRSSVIDNYDMLPVYYHVPGYSIVSVDSNLFMQEGMGDRVLDQMIRANIGYAVTRYLERVKKDDGFGNLLTVRNLIIVAVVIVVIFLWQNGTIPQLIQEIIPAGDMPK